MVTMRLPVRRDGRLVLRTVFSTNGMEDGILNGVGAGCLWGGLCFGKLGRAK